MIASDVVHGRPDDFEHWHQLYAILRTLTASVTTMQDGLYAMLASMESMNARIQELTEEVRWEDDDEDDDASDISWVESDHTSVGESSESEPDLITEDETSSTERSEPDLAAL
jgi:hypothetical protein